MFKKIRKAMVETQLFHRGIKDPRVIAAFLEVERHLFIREEEIELAYNDYPLPIGFGQTISQPYIVAYYDGKIKDRKKQYSFRDGNRIGI
ncbi:hypothetical protein [Psychrilyobacter sp.]|uniref:protein-L-isoaspartate O-methyltransferase family protein n=1 Tax=Psychrilyobacter sp. TaxID=2586924 RepID=UPI003017ED51